jgi:nitrate reductase assembly molybdenum cofactor insertion protein NarJ
MIDQAIQRAQAYYFFSQALIYPQDNWAADLPCLAELFQDLGLPWAAESAEQFSVLPVEDLQAQHREIFGLTGSLLYETELGLPHEFRQSQELADIAGFYRAFGFQAGAAVRERPDYLATELEFMYLLALKEAYAAEYDLPEAVEICADAQRKFLQDHLARWIGPFCRSLERSTGERLGEDGIRSPYILIARLAEAFLATEAARLGVAAAAQPAAAQKPTPFNPDITCAGCAAAEAEPAWQEERG